jgi:multidrug efflux pump subunit AcrA (membrane-fusion protein)
VPLGEVLFVPTLPAVVEGMTAVLGQQVTQQTASASNSTSSGGNSSPSAQGSGQQVMTLGTGGISVSGPVNQTDARTLRSGMAATLNDDSTGGQWSGAIASIGSAVVDSNGVPQQLISVAPGKTSPVPVNEIGQNIRVTVAAASTLGPVLVAPISAVFARADGRSFVTLVKSGRQIQVSVRVGLDQGGNVQITAAHGDLQPGDNVVVGSR